ncbi:MAG: hypothetical protein WA888_23290, partial [Burkholderiaceae bacterium]
MTLPPYASLGEKIWHYSFLLFCTAVFIFLISPILIIIPLSFNAEPYFTFSEGMLALEPEAYSLRWYQDILHNGMANPQASLSADWWWDLWGNSQWVRAARNSLLIAVASTIVATALGTLAALGLSRPEMPFRSLIT